MRSLKIYFLNNFYIYHAAMLTIVITLHIIVPVLIYLITVSLFLLTISSNSFSTSTLLLGTTYLSSLP